MPLVEEIIECASIAAYDFPVLLGPMKTVRGRSDRDALLIGPKFVINISIHNGAGLVCGADMAGW